MIISGKSGRGYKCNTGAMSVISIATLPTYNLAPGPNNVFDLLSNDADIANQDKISVSVNIQGADTTLFAKIFIPFQNLAANSLAKIRRIKLTLTNGTISDFAIVGSVP